MAEIKQNVTAQVPFRVAPLADLDTGADQVFQQIGNLADTVRRDVTKRLDKKMAAEGQVAGAKLGSRRGADGKLIPIEELPFNPSTTYGSNAINAAASAYESNLRVDLSSASSRALADHPDDPDAAMSVFSEYVDETQRNVAPQLKPFVDTTAAGYLQRIEAQATNEQVKRQRQEQSAALAADVSNSIEELNTLAYDGLGNSTASAELLAYTERKLLDAEASGLKINGKTVTPAARREMLRTMRQGIAQQAITGQVDRAMLSGQVDVGFAIAQQSEESLVNAGFSRVEARAAATTIKSRAGQLFNEAQQRKNIEEHVAQRPAKNALDAVREDPTRFTEEAILSDPRFSGQPDLRNDALRLVRGEREIQQGLNHEARMTVIADSIVQLNSGKPEDELNARQRMIDELRRSRSDHQRGRIDTTQFNQEQSALMDALFTDVESGMAAMTAMPTATPDAVAAYLTKWVGILPNDQLQELYTDYLDARDTSSLLIGQSILDGSYVSPTQKELDKFTEQYGAETVMDQAVFGPPGQMDKTQLVRGAKNAANAPFSAANKDNLQNALTMYQRQSESGEWDRQRLEDFWGRAGAMKLAMMNERLSNPDPEDVDDQGNPRVGKIMAEVSETFRTSDQDTVRAFRSVGLDFDPESGAILRNNRWEEIRDEVTTKFGRSFFERFIRPGVNPPLLGGVAGGFLFNSAEPFQMTQEATRHFDKKLEVFLREQARFINSDQLDKDAFWDDFVDSMMREDFAVVERNGEEMFDLRPPEFFIDKVLRQSGLSSVAELDPAEKSRLVQVELAGQLKIRNALFDGDVPVNDREFTMFKATDGSNAFEVFWREEGEDGRWQALEVPMKLRLTEENMLLPGFLRGEFQGEQNNIFANTLRLFGGDDAVLKPNKWYLDNIVAPGAARNTFESLWQDDRRMADALQTANDVRGALGLPQIILPNELQGKSLDEAAKIIVKNREKYQEWAMDGSFGDGVIPMTLRLMFGDAEVNANRLDGRTEVAPKPKFETPFVDSLLDKVGGFFRNEDDGSSGKVPIKDEIEVTDEVQEMGAFSGIEDLAKASVEKMKQLFEGLKPEFTTNEKGEPDPPVLELPDLEKQFDEQLEQRLKEFDDALLPKALKEKAKANLRKAHKEAVAEIREKRKNK